MTIHDTEKPADGRQECFLCVLDPRHTCTVRQLEGRLRNAFERNINGEKFPTLVLDVGTEQVEVRLPHHYYHTLIKELRERGKAIYQVTIRLYHLPSPPDIVEYNGQIRQAYTANSYTLAVLEPDVVLNITDLNHAEYCTRQYLLHRLVPSTTSAATIRGNLVHHCFKELLKEHDRGELMQGHDQQGLETPQAILYRHFEQALEQSRIDLALANVPSEDIRADVSPHLESLATWYQKQSSTLWDLPVGSTKGTAEPDGQRNENVVRAETFLLAPEIGLRGRLDVLWQQSNRHQLLELKTGGATGNLPRSSHRWQVQGYHALLAVRRDSKMKKARGTLLYSGTPGEAQTFGIEPTIRDIQRVNESRSMLVLSHITGTPSAPPGPSRCTKCTMLDQCQQVSWLLDWQPPAIDKQEEQAEKRVGAGAEWMGGGDPCGRPSGGVLAPRSCFNEEEKAFFAKYYWLLHIEEREGEQQQALLWKISVEERIERGNALGNLQPLGKPEPTGRGEWEQDFLCSNTSELREGDEILLSDGNPITGEVVTGTIKQISAERVRVWTPELIAHPSLLDRHETNIVHIRTVQNLFRWLQADVHLRQLVAGKIRPRFEHKTVAPRASFNTEQNLAVERALQMQDYVLIQGPPGTGKTSVIAEIVKRLCARGERVMLAAFTNQAVDNMLKRLDTEGFHMYVRLGHDRGVHGDVEQRLLKNLVEEESVRDILRKMPVVASTTATWSSEKYAAQTSNGTEHTTEPPPLQFDVAIVDEASQLTIPSILGALRLAKRFILVGDEKQLPPLVLSKEAAEQGLADSLFSYLKQRDDSYRQEHLEAESACVSLRVQYRMNRWISNFPSRVFYENKLEAAPTVARCVLEIATKGQWLQTERRQIGQALQPEYPLVFVDVGLQEKGAGLKSSDAEAHAVRDIVRGLLARGIIEQDIGIIAPYRAQVANIRRHLFSDDSVSNWSALPSNTPLSVDTVDRFQGGERMVIIMSFATTQMPEPESLQREFLTNPHRFNVALTRAQRKLIVVGCAQALEGLPYFSRLLAYCQSMGTVIEYSQVPPP